MYPGMITAGDLNANEHIGKQIRFRLWDNNRETATVITGELRQISSNGTETYVHYGNGAYAEATLANDQPVTIDPPDDHGDVPLLAVYDESA